MAACQLAVKQDERLNTVRCGRSPALPVRLACPRLGHVEESVLCSRCITGIMYCEECFNQDRLLVRVKPVLAPN